MVNAYAPKICPKLLVLLRMYTDSVRTSELLAMFCLTDLLTVPSVVPVKTKTGAAPKGKSPDGVIDTRSFTHTGLVRSCDQLNGFVAAFSTRSPLASRVAGSWSSRGASAGTISMSPVAFTRVAVVERRKVASEPRAPSSTRTRVHQAATANAGALGTTSETFPNTSVATAHP